MRAKNLILKPRQITQALKREGKTLTELANECNVSRSTLYRYVKRPGTMPVSVWVTIVDSLHLNTWGDD